ncbi:MAG: Smr/MutS family protein [Saprospiraceae bacterium]|nr:Smr/MutS family protein [Saprospiraceae bacterium]
MVFLEEFLEKAIINNAHELRIIHGVGNGTLKRKVHEKFREYKDIKKYWHPEENLGGEGVTLCQSLKGNDLFYFSYF